MHHQSKQDQKLGQTLHLLLKVLLKNYKSLSWICLSSIIAKTEQHHKRVPVKRIYPQAQKIIIPGFAAHIVVSGSTLLVPKFFLKIEWSTPSTTFTTIVYFVLLIKSLVIKIPNLTPLFLPVISKLHSLDLIF